MLYKRVSSNILKLENRIDPLVQAALRKKGHNIELVESYSDIMGTPERS